ncbi:hypothetical protein ACCO45_009884 [Purpureocillium lilacinum]|uniref:Uncharacterized protein n=1 Tax=Purpureocillium lilacinum TaxID=33203 RepID=A0ACC4DKK8_PURLI
MENFEKDRDNEELQFAQQLLLRVKEAIEDLYNGKQRQAIAEIEAVVEAKNSLVNNFSEKLFSFEFILALVYQQCGFTQKAVDLLRDVRDYQYALPDLTAKSFDCDVELAMAHWANGEDELAEALLEGH